MLEFFITNVDKFLFWFLAAEFICVTLSMVFPKIEYSLSTIGYTILAISDFFVFLNGIINDDWMYLIISVALMVCVILLVKVSTALNLAENFSNDYDEIAETKEDS